MKDRTACFTGHRRIPAEQYDSINERLTQSIISLIHKGYRFFGTGGALGFDTMAAQAVLMLKYQYPHICLILVLPCRTQTRGWSEHDRAVYEYIKVRADKVVYTAQQYSTGCMHKRNRHLVDNSSACICYLSQNTGGTAYTVNYARMHGLEVINIAENSERRQQIPVQGLLASFLE